MEHMVMSGISRLLTRIWDLPPAETYDLKIEKDLGRVAKCSRVSESN